MGSRQPPSHTRCQWSQGYIFSECFTVSTTGFTLQYIVLSFCPIYFQVFNQKQSENIIYFNKLGWMSLQIQVISPKLFVSTDVL